MNIAFITIKPNVDYQNLATLAGITFTKGDRYILQVVEGDGLWIQEALFQPTEGGFTITQGEKNEYIADGGALWVKNRSSEVDVKLNIAIFTGD